MKNITKKKFLFWFELYKVYTGKQNGGFSRNDTIVQPDSSLEKLEKDSRRLDPKFI